MKTQTRVLALLVAGIAAVTAALFAATPQPPKREPQVFTIKANGKAVAVLTLDVLSDGPVEISAENLEFRGKEGEHGTARIKGGVTVRFRGEPAELEIKAEEVQMEMRK